MGFRAAVSESPEALRFLEAGTAGDIGVLLRVGFGDSAAVDDSAGVAGSGGGEVDISSGVISNPPSISSAIVSEYVSTVEAGEVI